MSDIDYELDNQSILTAAAEPVRSVVLRTARDLTCGDRNEQYGDPVEQHRVAAEIFNARTQRKDERALTARDVMIVLSSVKQSRRLHNPTHQDSYVDDSAYIAMEYEAALAEE